MVKHTQAGAALDSGMDELDRYMADGCVPTQDPLLWWIANRKLYPNLSKLAISVHSIPGTLSLIIIMLILIIVLGLQHPR